MTAEIIDGKAMSSAIYQEVADNVSAIKATHGLVPGLAVVLVGSDAASQIYVNAKHRRAAEVGIRSFVHRMSENSSEEELLSLIATLNGDSQVHGILIQLPLPGHIDVARVINTLNPNKDVDGFHIENVGKIGTGQHAIVPCTPRGCMMMLRQRFADLTGKTALVIGHSNVVGRPMGRLLLNANCTVMVTHKYSTNIPQLARLADIVVVAAGVPGLVKGDWIKPGATVIDVGINRITKTAGREAKLGIVGDVVIDEVLKVAGAITPVPGGVGPMTIACLLANTLSAFCHLQKIPQPQLHFEK